MAPIFANSQNLVRMFGEDKHSVAINSDRSVHMIQRDRYWKCVVTVRRCYLIRRANVNGYFPAIFPNHLIFLRGELQWSARSPNLASVLAIVAFVHYLFIAVVLGP